MPLCSGSAHSSYVYDSENTILPVSQCQNVGQITENAWTIYKLSQGKYFCTDRIDPCNLNSQEIARALVLKALFIIFTHFSFIFSVQGAKEMNSESILISSLCVSACVCVCITTTHMYTCVYTHISSSK